VPQAAWESRGVRDANHYDPTPLGGTGGGGVRWTGETFFAGYTGRTPDPWTGEMATIDFPSLAGQFNSAMRRHRTETPAAVNAWGFNHHVVNVLSADLSGLSGNWAMGLEFMRDIADGAADGAIGTPRPDLVRFVTMQELGAVYELVAGTLTTDRSLPSEARDHSRP
jgi:hypothetical protein